MAELAFPYYQLIANGPDETALYVTVQVATGAHGPLPDLDGETLALAMRQVAADAGALSTELVRFDATQTPLE